MGLPSAVMREETYVDEDKGDGDDNGSIMGKHFINIVSSVLSPDKVFNANISILQMRKPSLRVLKYLSCLYSLQVAQDSELRLTGLSVFLITLLSALLLKGADSGQPSLKGPGKFNGFVSLSLIGNWLFDFSEET